MFVLIEHGLVDDKWNPTPAGSYLSPPPLRLRALVASSLQKTPFPLNFSYVCPEPVLAYRSFLAEQWLKKRRLPHRYSSRNVHSGPSLLVSIAPASFRKSLQRSNPR